MSYPEACAAAGEADSAPTKGATADRSGGHPTTAIHVAPLAFNRAGLPGSNSRFPTREASCYSKGA